MSEWAVFECDVTGERFGAKNDVREYELRRHRAGCEFEVFSETVHLSDEALDGVGYHNIPSPTSVDFIGVKDERAVGINIRVGRDGSGSCVWSWEERGSVVVDHYEEFFTFLDREVLYGDAE